MPKQTIDLKDLKRVLRYDPKTGMFFWLIAPAKRVRAGSVAGVLRKDGYIQIKYKNRAYKVNRLAWAFMTGFWPASRKLVVEHRDGNKTNDRWDNLFLVTCYKNQQNLRDKIRKDNRSGCRGVSVRPDGKWHARITVNKQIITLGVFVDLQEAIAARKAAEMVYFPVDRHRLIEL